VAVGKIKIADLASELKIEKKDVVAAGTKLGLKLTVFTELDPVQAESIKRSVRGGAASAPAAVPASAAEAHTERVATGIIRRRREVSVEPTATPATPVAARTVLPPPPTSATPITVRSTTVLRRVAQTTPEADAAAVKADQTEHEAPAVESHAVELVEAAEVPVAQPGSPSDTAQSTAESDAAGPEHAPEQVEVAPVAHAGEATPAREPPAEPGVTATDAPAIAPESARAQAEAATATAEVKAPPAPPIPPPAQRIEQKATPVSRPPARAPHIEETLHGGRDTGSSAVVQVRSASSLGRPPSLADLKGDGISTPMQHAGPLPSQSRRPTLVRTAMPDYLVNIPKPTLKVKETATPTVDPEVLARRAVVPTTPATDATRRPTAEDRKKAAEVRGGKRVVFDRKNMDARGAMAGDDDVRVRSRRRRQKQMAVAKPASPTPSAAKRVIRIEETITVGELAHQLSIKAGEVMKKLFDLGTMATINQTVDLDTATLVAGEFGYTVENVAFQLDDYVPQSSTADADLKPRPPVVTVMGHVDHGKTSLLDVIRSARVAEGEAGGITQHIGAYQVIVPSGGKVVFLDTPGHEAFTAMRARGAKVTDVVVLVVAADDGVMPQTVEAINHAKAAEVPIIVAINKIDKDNANLDRVKQELANQGLVGEAWGGETIFCEVSAKKRIGIEHLLEMLALQTEILDLHANPDCPARGVVLEAKIERGRGPVATVLINEGTLHIGDYVVTGTVYGRVRAMMDDRAKATAKAGPATPVEVLGLDGVPEAGEDFYVVKEERQAKTIVEHRLAKKREKDLAKTSKSSLEDLFRQIQEGETKEVRLIVKADVQGSCEALKAAFGKLIHPDVKIRVLHDAVGGINESDVNLANASHAIIIGFNVKAEANARALAESLKVDIRYYSVIYDAIDDVKAAMEGKLAPTLQEKILGTAEVRNIFPFPKGGNIAGCSVATGRLTRSAQVRVRRGAKVVFEGRFASLRRFKDDVREVEKGFECGVRVDGFPDVQVGDVLECFEIEEIAQKLGV